MILALISAEAMWNTKISTMEFFEKMDRLRLIDDGEYSIRSEPLKLIKRIFRHVRNMNLKKLMRDPSDIVIFIGLPLTVALVSPDVFKLVGTILSISAGLVFFFGNKCLIIFCLYKPFMSTQTFSVLFLIVAMIVSGILIAVMFYLMITTELRDVFDYVTGMAETYLNDQGISFDEKLSKNTRDTIKDFLTQFEKEWVSNSSWAEVARYAISTIESLEQWYAENYNQQTTQNSVMNYFFPPSCFELTFESYKDYYESAKCVWETGFNMTEVMSSFHFDLSMEGGYDVLLYSLKPTFISIMATISILGTAIFLVLDAFLRLAMFFVFHFAFLDSKETALAGFLALGPSSRHFTADNSFLLMFETELRSSLEAVVMAPIKMGILNCLASLFVFYLFQMPFKFMHASLVFFFSIVPLVSPFLPISLWLLSMYMTGTWSFVWAGCVFGVNYAFQYLIATWIIVGYKIKFTSGYKQKRINDADDYLYGKREYFLSYGMLLGFIPFGIKGILLGPFVLCNLVICHKVFLAYTELTLISDRERRMSKRDSVELLTPEQKQSLRSSVDEYSDEERNQVTDPLHSSKLHRSASTGVLSENHEERSNNLRRLRPAGPSIMQMAETLSAQMIPRSDTITSDPNDRPELTKDAVTPTTFHETGVAGSPRSSGVLSPEMYYQEVEQYGVYLKNLVESGEITQEYRNELFNELMEDYHAAMKRRTRMLG
eukprot:snap_masked-scaffold_12-processed-gene-8.36-mRNA-1 protein AED:1.00 eAED:1.00 QI:0/0/0/0/1/1/2/0/714